MHQKLKFSGLLFSILNIIGICVIITGVYFVRTGRIALPNINKMLVKIPILIVSPTPTNSPTPTPIEYKVTFISVPTQAMEGESVSFTWYVHGSNKIIHSSSVYISKTSMPGLLTKDTTPMQTRYHDNLPEFIKGDYTLPIQFVGNIRLGSPGAYYARAYALIDDQHYWSDEISFVVTQIPKHTINMIDNPKSKHINETATFTWDISGPAAVTGFTAIVGGKNSKPGELSDTLIVSQSPYSMVLVKDFVSGVYNIPLRFIGNTYFTETGTYYFRGFAFINGKNIWSEESSILLE